MTNLSSLLLEINQKIKFLQVEKNNAILTLEELWILMDRVWDEMGCNNHKIQADKISQYYQNPVWTLNGLFTEIDSVSIFHRNAIAKWIHSKENEILSVLDYGGGFGSLAKSISDEVSSIKIDIYEPYPTELALSKLSSHPNINFISSINAKYHCLVATDVLEHVPDPILLLGNLIDNVQDGGYIILANCFYPVIKCHLPQTFHLRYSLNSIAKSMGLQVIGKCDETYAVIYRKPVINNINWAKVRSLELVSKLLFPAIEILYPLYKKIKK